MPSALQRNHSGLLEFKPGAERKAALRLRDSGVLSNFNQG